jgi:hypothetical protein
VALTVLGIVWLIRREWFVGSALLVATVLISIIGASLHPGKSGRELARGIPLVPAASADDDDRDSYRLAKAAMSFSAVMGALVLALLLHRAMRPWPAILIALGVAWAYLAASCLSSAWPSKKGGT